MQMGSLDIAGYRGESVPNRFFRQDDETDRLAIILPGYGQSADTPLLYFTTSHFLDLRADILLIDYRYSQRADYQELDAGERQRWLSADTTAACRAALAARHYRRITLVGKSLGTRAMAHLLATEEPLRGADTIWFTPVWREEPVRAALLAAEQRALVVIGTADPHYDPHLADEVRQAINGELLVIPDAEHGLEIEGDVIRSVRALETVMRAVVRFVAQS